MTQFQIVSYNVAAEGTFTGPLQSQTFETDDPAAAFAVRGYTITPRTGGAHLRKELQGQPCFKELVGPMWGGEHNGKPLVRYEDSPANDLMSR